MAVEGDDALEAVGVNTAEDIGQQVLEGFQAEVDGAGESHVIVGEAGPHWRGDDDREIVDAPGDFDGHVKGTGNVHVHGTVRAVLLHRTHRHNDHRILLEGLEELVAPHLLPEHFLVVAVVRSSVHGFIPPWRKIDAGIIFN